MYVCPTWEQELKREGFIFMLSSCLYVCMHVCTYVCMYVCTYIYTCMYQVVYMCVCSMYVCLYVCMYVPPENRSWSEKALSSCYQVVWETDARDWYLKIPSPPTARASRQNGHTRCRRMLSHIALVLLYICVYKYVRTYMYMCVYIYIYIYACIYV